MDDLKKCNKCKNTYPIDQFSFRNDTQKLRNYCKQCEKNAYKKYYLENRFKIKENNKSKYYENNLKWRANNVDKYSAIKKKYRDKIENKIKMEEYRANNKEKIAKQTREYYLTNKDEINKYTSKYKRKRRKTDPMYSLRMNISRSICRYLKNNGGSKNNQLCLNFLSFSIEQLKDHLGLQFEWWMNWENHGIYNKNEWKDDNHLTWKWQIDHIIPQAKLPCNSINHPNFKKCWALNNLRPLSAKQNIIDGDRS